MNTLPATTTQPKGLDTFETAQRHLAAAKSLGKDISLGLSRDAQALSEQAKRTYAAAGIVHDGIREEARKIDEFLAASAARIDKLLAA